MSRGEKAAELTDDRINRAEENFRMSAAERLSFKAWLLYILYGIESANKA
jgi:hypothetical protein